LLTPTYPLSSLYYDISKLVVYIISIPIAKPAIVEAFKTFLFWIV
jgi:hypothetical protein